MKPCLFKERFKYEPCRTECDGYNTLCKNYLAKHIRQGSSTRKIEREAPSSLTFPADSPIRSLDEIRRLSDGGCYNG